MHYRSRYQLMSRYGRASATRVSSRFSIDEPEITRYMLKTEETAIRHLKYTRVQRERRPDRS